MSVVSLFTHNYAVFHKALIFLMRLAWKSRIRLPYLIMIGFMALDIRLTLEIVIDVDHQPPDNGLHHSNTSSDSEDSEDFHETFIAVFMLILYYPGIFTLIYQYINLKFWCMKYLPSKLLTYNSNNIT